MKPLALVASTLVILAAALVEAWYLGVENMFGLTPAGDLAGYVDGVRRWLGTGSPYIPSEVAAPFVFTDASFLHPPIALPAFMPWLVLPVWSWYAIPVAIVAWCFWAWKPARWAWPLLALACLNPRFQFWLLSGNSDLWVAAGLAAGLRIRWPSALIALKPSFFPLALIGIRTRHWWIAMAALIALAIPFGALWLQWFQVTRNSQFDPFYSLGSVTWLYAVPLAWWARQEVRPKARTKSHLPLGRAPN